MSNRSICDEIDHATYTKVYNEKARSVDQGIGIKIYNCICRDIEYEINNEIHNEIHNEINNEINNEIHKIV